MRVLITGGAGFIGSNLVRMIERQNPVTELRVLDDLSTGRLANLEGSAVDFIEDTILDRDAVDRAVADVDSIVHLAALGSVPRSVLAPRATHEVNATGTLNVLEAARQAGVEHVIVASSSSVYGSNTAIPKRENDWTRPMSPYAASKLATESYALAYQHAYGLPTLAFRFFNVFGPAQRADHDYAAVIPRFLEAALSGRPVEIHGDGLQSRDFTFVDTVCSAIVDALGRRLSVPDPVNLAFGSSTTILELVGLLERVLGMDVATRFVEERRGDVRASQADGLRIRELFPEVSPTSLPQALERTVAWFRADLVSRD